jgi:hypothetical protein
MPPSFPEIPEPAAGSEPPLQALAGCNQRLLRHCATLRRLALSLGECGFDADARAANGQLLRFFDHALPLHHADQQDELVPALIESMAGSDAVCLRELGERLAGQHRESRRLWLQLRPALLQLASGRPAALPVQEVEAFIDHCQDCVTLEDGELLPMAARLLSDAQLAQLDDAMRGRRAGPT